MRILLETSKLAKEKGFKKKTRKSYKQPVVTKRGTGNKEERDYKLFKTDYQYCSTTEVTFPNEDFYAPTQSQLQTWLRDKHGIQVNVIREYDYWTPVLIFILRENLEEQIPSISKSYETALEVGLEYALKKLNSVN